MKESIFTEKFGRHHLNQAIPCMTADETDQNCMLLNRERTQYHLCDIVAKDTYTNHNHVKHQENPN